MSFKPKGFHIGGKTVVNERSAFRFGENRYTPIVYSCAYPKRELLKRMKDLIENTGMTSSNESFPIPAAWSVVDTTIQWHRVQRADHHEIIDQIAREDARIKHELENNIEAVEEFCDKVVVK